MTPCEIHQFLDSFINFEVGTSYPAAQFFKLERIENLLTALGRPHQQLKCIHVAGTKGKGTTCAFVAHILEKAGYIVGLYTSPHLNNIKERIRILGLINKAQEEDDIFPDCISYFELGSLIEENSTVLEDFRSTARYGKLTYFEVLTALAFLYFRKQGVDFAVLETGLGGRLDATNVVDPLVIGLTPISLEHTMILGPRIDMIAREKAAIIKPNRPVIVALQKQEVKDVIINKGRDENARLYFVGKDITFEAIQVSPQEQSFRINGLHGEYRVTTRLLGEHQMMNAATAVGIVESLRDYDINVNAQAINQGLNETSWPCRFEIIQNNPWIVLDAAHNPESIEVLARTVEAVFPGNKVILILGISRDKDIPGICSHARKLAKGIILTKANHPRAFEFDCATQKIFAGTPMEYIPDLTDAVALALTKIEKDDVILIAGSVFVAAEARAMLLKNLKVRSG